MTHAVSRRGSGRTSGESGFHSLVGALCPILSLCHLSTAIMIYRGIREWRSADHTFRSRFTTRAGCSKIKPRPTWPSCFAVRERAFNIIGMFVIVWHCLYFFWTGHETLILIHYYIMYKLSLSHTGVQTYGISALVFHRTISSATSTQCPLIDDHLLVPLFFGVWIHMSAEFSNLFASNQHVWMLMVLALC